MKRWQPRRRTWACASAAHSMASTTSLPAWPRASRNLAVALCGGGNSKVDQRTLSSPAAANISRCLRVDVVGVRQPHLGDALGEDVGVHRHGPHPRPARDEARMGRADRLLHPGEGLGQGRTQRHLRCVVGRHDEDAAGLEHAGDLPHAKLGTHQVLDDLAEHHHVERLVPERQVLGRASARRRRQEDRRGRRTSWPRRSRGDRRSRRLRRWRRHRRGGPRPAPSRRRCRAPGRPQAGAGAPQRPRGRSASRDGAGGTRPRCRTPPQWWGLLRCSGG